MTDLRMQRAKKATWEGRESRKAEVPHTDNPYSDARYEDSYYLFEAWARGWVYEDANIVPTGNLCLFCVYLYFDPGTQGYSDMTPGSQMCIECTRSHWIDIGYNDTEESFRQKILLARICKEFSRIDMTRLK